MSSLGEEYPKEQQRCREILAVYEKLGPVGQFGAIHIKKTLRKADEAAVSGDVVAMLQMFEEMKAIKE